VSSASSASAPTTCPRNTGRDELFIEGFVVVYTDGACSNNHERAKRVAGVGAFWGRKHPFNVSTPLDGHVQTNNRSELTAVIRVLQIELRNIDIRSDSAYVVDGVHKRLEKWRRQGFASKAGAIKNHDLWMQLSRLLQERPPGSWKLTKVKGHASARDILEGKVTREDKEGNDWADALAVAGCTKSRALRGGDPLAERMLLTKAVQKMMTDILLAREVFRRKTGLKNAECEDEGGREQSADYEDGPEQDGVSTSSSMSSARTSAAGRRRGRSAPAAAE
jgi:ribonuclease HI